METMRDEPNKKGREAMKKEVFVLAVFLGLFLVTSPITSHALDPAESQAADPCGERFEAAPTNHYMAAAESQEVDRTGERFVAGPSNDYMAAAESQEVERTGTPSVEVNKSDIVACK